MSWQKHLKEERLDLCSRFKGRTCHGEKGQSWRMEQMVTLCPQPARRARTASYMCLLPEKADWISWLHCVHSQKGRLEQLLTLYPQPGRRLEQLVTLCSHPGRKTGAAGYIVSTLCPQSGSSRRGMIILHSLSPSCLGLDSSVWNRITQSGQVFLYQWT